MCDYLGLPYREEVQWVCFLIFFILLPFSTTFASFFDQFLLVFLSLNIGFIVWTPVGSLCDIFSSF